MKTIRCTTRLVAAAAAIAWLATPLLAQDNRNDRAAEAALQAAINREVVDGNLTDAIAQYTKLIETHANSRAVAAKALYHLGQAHEKLGNTEARKAYERIAREFADQKDVAADAGRRLAVLSGSTANGRPTSSLAWKGNKVSLSGSISDDGRYLSFIDWDSGSVALHDFITGEDRVIVEAKHADKDKWSVWAESTALSRDGRQVAYHWYDRTNGAHCAIWIANVTGDPAPRRCYDGQDAVWLEAKEWSPDGKWVSVLIYSKTDTQLGLISVTDGSLRVLRSAERIGNTGVFFSPDGKYVGYDIPYGDSKRCDVWLTALDGTGHTPVVVHLGDDRIMGWSPDGKRLLFRSDRTGAMALWSLPINNGKPGGAPALLKPDMGNVGSLGLSRTGAMFYGVSTGRAGIIGTVEIGSFDVGTGALVSVRDVSDDYLEGNSAPCWSPDGKYLAYNSSRDGVRPAIVIRSGETNRVIRELPHKLRLGTGPGGLAGWEPNGRALLVSASVGEGRWGAYRVDVESGAVDLLCDIPSPQGSSQPRPQWSADGKSIYYHRKLSGNDGQSFVQREIASGAEREVIRRPSLGGLHLSPDGKYIATESIDPSSNDRIVLLVQSGGAEAREVMREKQVEEGDQTSVKFWVPDSRSFFVAKRRGNVGNELWQVSVAGGAPRKLDSLLPANILKFTLHPDGKTVALRKEEPRRESVVRSKEVWVLENFLDEQSTRIAIGRLDVSEILEPNNSIFDPHTGLRAKCPAGWVVHGAARYAETFSKSDKPSLYVNIRQPELEIGSSFCQISLHFDEPKKNLAGKEIEAWLRNWADTSHLKLRNGDRSYGLKGYRNRPGTFVMRSIAGRAALSWESEGNWRGKDVIEHVTAIYWESGWCEARCYVQRGASAEERDRMLSGYNRFVDSVRLP